MEKRKISLSELKVCRFCLSQNEPMKSLYDRSGEQKNKVTLLQKILSSVSVEVFPSDRMPLYICNRCRFFMDICYSYKNICRQADKSIFEFVQCGAALRPIDWPSNLVTTFRAGVKASRDVGVVKTVVEGGATVEVTSQEMSDSDEGDENVYKVKIEDGQGEGSACIKVVTSQESHGIAMTNPKGLSQAHVSSGADSDDGCDREATKTLAPRLLSDGCWACDECECTYPLQQLLELHKMQKHRARKVPCDQCDAKFFSKYDLMTHQLRHSDEMPFQCVACDRMFKRLVLLKRHERFMHADLPQHKCPNCPATYLSLEELEAHQSRHSRYGERAFACTVCDKKFHNRGALQRHEYTMHVETPKLSCEYCPQRFSSVTKLTRHVRTHAGERPYPCKYCDKSFLKSHHYTRHLRVKHREMMGGSVGGSDAYRCEQCEDTFTTQDELIYHSAIHATQNLTCPLCQEKFEDVDAVTAHIKSHVNGMEFMCDFCELVFTSKDKLDNHIAHIHEDEASQVPDLGQNESSMEMDAEEEEDYNTINLKEEDDHMVVEIKKADDFMIINPQPLLEEKMDNTNSEESESEVTYMDMPTVDTLAVIKKASPVKAPPENPPVKLVAATFTPKTVVKIEKSSDGQTASILRKAEEIKRKVVQQQSSETSIREKKEKPVSKVEISSTGGNDKSLRLLEKELQELKRTTTRNDASKTPAKTSESLRSSRRPQLHTSTPKLRSVDEKKPQAPSKTPAVDKKVPERRAVKENKEPKEGKDARVPIGKEDKEAKANNSSAKEEKEREAKENETPKSVVKNGTADKNVAEESVRRSTRPSKIKDYAKMIRERSQPESEEDDSDDDDEEYVETEKTPESRLKTRRGAMKPPPPKTVKPTATPVAAVRKRGRPRREQPAEVPVKVKKEENENDEEAKSDKIADAMQGSGISKEKLATPEREKSGAKEKEETEKRNVDENSNADPNKTPDADQKPAGVLVSPTGQTLKKVPIKALPPGVRPIPLPANARPMGTGELCEMQIGKKVVKVQKIVMTKAEVEAMAKKGLVEMKDGTMVLKQGIKIPTSDPVAIKSSLVGEESEKESPIKKDKATPTRCEFNEDA